MMCTLCCADRHETPRLGCPGANATGPQRIRWNWNAKYRKGASRTIRLNSHPIVTLYDANWQRLATLVRPPA